METYNNNIHIHSYNMRQVLTTASRQRQPAIVTKTQATYVRLYNLMHQTIDMCMSKYKYHVASTHYLYWMDVLKEVISDEIDGYVKHQYTRIPSSSPLMFIRFIEEEFDELIVPVLDRIVNRDRNKMKRQAIIAEVNDALLPIQQEQGQNSKVVINTDANEFYFF